MAKSKKEASPKSERLFPVKRILKRSNVEIIVRASRDNWIKMRNFYLNPSCALKLFLDMYPLFHEGYIKSLPHKKHKRHQYFIDVMKVQAYLLNKFFSYWFRSIHKPPRYVTSIKYDADYEKYLRNRIGKPIPMAFAAYCMDMVYREWLKVNKVDPFLESLDNFKKTYIDGGKSLLQKDGNLYFDGLSSIHGEILLEPVLCGDKEIFDLLHNLMLALRFHFNLPYKYASSMFLSECEARPNFKAIYRDIEKIYPRSLAVK